VGSSSSVGVPPGDPDGARWRRAAAAHVFVADLDATTITLADDDAHHLGRVLRLRRGQPVSASDGAGRWRACEYGDGALVPAGAVRIVAGAEPVLTVAFAVPKGDRADWAVQKLTEAGVDRIVPLRTARGVVHPDPERVERQLARWNGIARQAAMQSRRVSLPRLGPPCTPIEALVACRPAGAGSAVALADPDGEPLDLGHPSVLVGPEGGWAPEELGLGCPLVRIGEQVLRTETAAVLAGGILAYLRSRRRAHPAA